MYNKSASIVTVFLLLAATAAADTMTFEGVLTNRYITGGSYTENGIMLSPVGTLWIAGPGGSTCGFGGCLDNGTNVGVVYVTSGLLMEAGGLFTLTSLDYGYPFRDTGGATSLEVTGFQNNTPLYSTMLLLNVGAGFQTARLDWTGIDRVRLTGSGGASDYFSIDNIRVNEPDVQPVPEPTTFTLAGLGLFCLRARLKKLMRK